MYRLLLKQAYEFISKYEIWAYKIYSSMKLIINPWKTNIRGVLLLPVNNNKTIEELLDLEEELKDKIQTEENASYYELIQVYETMYKKIARDTDSEYQPSLNNIKDKLIFHLIKHGTYLKTVYQKDDRTAESCMKRAIFYEKNLPIAYYRLGFLHYKKRSYTVALLHFQDALRYEEREGDGMYKMNEQQLYNCRLYLANCGLFIAQKAYEELKVLNLKAEMQKVLNYVVSPYYELIRDNEQYLGQHEYCMVSKNNTKYCGREECEEAQDIKGKLILDFTDRRISLIYNGRMTTLSGNHAEILRLLLIKSEENKPLTKNVFYDIFSVSNASGEISSNTYIQNITRIRRKLREIGIPKGMIVNKVGSPETGYYCEQSIPYIIIHRTDETFILN
ncbi:response regulator transcription factor [Bacillus sp. Marseille-Q1617]|uniref:response regulator transcription factor n=1 Tax=Bacillus sp. Marseille-Q1617 TaxID=2736887 RepID=UPI00158B01F3|nr:response regulator transcription factor [Bacillus sp. Marseille-Q1617]